MDDVVANIREQFLDEGIDEQVLIELKQMWENKLLQSKAIDSVEPTPEQPTPVQRQATADQRNTNIVNQTSLGASNIMQPTVLQYAPQVNSNDSQKTLTLSMPQHTHTINSANGPQKVTITLPAHMAHSGLPTVMSAPAATATLALPPEIAASLLNQPGTIAALNQAGLISAPHQNISISGGTEFLFLNQIQLGLLQNAQERMFFPLNRTNKIYKEHNYAMHTIKHAENQRIQYQAVAVTQANVPVTTALATSQSVQHIHLAPNQKPTNLVQLDGTQDTSDEDEDDFQDDHQDDEEEQNDDENEDEGEEDEPLNSEDDVSDEDPSDLFDTDNVVVCQYDKITRCRNKWKFHLKDGIMSLNGKDYVFHKSVGDAEW
ncbi:Transcription initiation factor IIA subunit 1 [Nymphon striatum]|nr:Transcription initiation factor IIA subunit 1 [Nymphon striatum]